MLGRSGETGRRARAGARPGVEPMEGRALLSAGVLGSPKLAALRDFRIPTGQATPSEIAQVMAAIRKGAGAEFITLIRREVKNLQSVIAGFSMGLINEYRAPGIVLKVPKFQELYTGIRFDQLSATAAGAVLAGRNRLVLGAIMRGPIDDPTPSTYGFGFDRSGGSLTSSPFANRPDIRYDATVTVTVAGGGVSGFVTDLNTGAETPLARKAIRIRGAALRVTLNPNLLPSTGARLSACRFAFWSRGAAEGGLETIASFAPEEQTIPIGTLVRVR